MVDCQYLSDKAVLLYRKAYAEVSEDKYRLSGDSVDKDGVYHRFRRRLPVVACALLFLWLSTNLPPRVPAFRIRFLRFDTHVVLSQACSATVTMVCRRLGRQFALRPRTPRTLEESVLELLRTVRCTDRGGHRNNICVPTAYPRDQVYQGRDWTTPRSQKLRH